MVSFGLKKASANFAIVDVLSSVKLSASRDANNQRITFVIRKFIRCGANSQKGWLLEKSTPAALAGLNGSTPVLLKPFFRGFSRFKSRILNP